MSEFPPDAAAPVPCTPVTDRESMTALETVCLALLQRGWAARLVNVCPAGEYDVRLLVGPPGSDVAVEVLGPCETRTEAPRWFAVRADLEHERNVWQGPAQPCPTEALLAFIDALAEAEPDRCGRYTVLG
jgi:hypothetical protein